MDLVLLSDGLSLSNPEASAHIKNHLLGASFFVTSKRASLYVSKTAVRSSDNILAALESVEHICGNACFTLGLKTMTILT